MSDTTWLSIDELRKLPHATFAAFGGFEGDGDEVARATAIMDAYLHDFLVPRLHPDMGQRLCVRCGVVVKVYLSAWGLRMADNFGDACTQCGYPGMSSHQIKLVDGTFTMHEHMQYHPDSEVGRQFLTAEPRP